LLLSILTFLPAHVSIYSSVDFGENFIFFSKKLKNSSKARHEFPPHQSPAFYSSGISGRTPSRPGNDLPKDQTPESSSKTLPLPATAILLNFRFSFADGFLHA